MSERAAEFVSEGPGLVEVVSAEPLSMEPVSAEHLSKTLAEAVSVADLPIRAVPAVVAATARAMAKAMSLVPEQPVLKHPELATAPELVSRCLLTPALGVLRRRREPSPADLVCVDLCRL